MTPLGQDGPGILGGGFQLFATVAVLQDALRGVGHNPFERGAAAKPEPEPEREIPTFSQAAYIVLDLHRDDWAPADWRGQGSAVLTGQGHHRQPGQPPLPVHGFGDGGQAVGLGVLCLAAAGRPRTGNAKSGAQRQREVRERRAKRMGEMSETERWADAMMNGMDVQVYGHRDGKVTRVVVSFAPGAERNREGLTAFAHSQGLDLTGWLCRVFAASLERQMRAGLVARQEIDVESILELID